MEKNRCIFCMHEMDVKEKRCPNCRKGAWEYKWNNRWLHPHTKLCNRYKLGIVIGEGASGITYLAYDTQEAQRVAVKEYFPAGKVRREQGTQKVAECGEGTAEEFKRGLEGFQREAMRLSEKRQVPGIVEEKDYFTELNTGYIVMEYLSGDSLRTYMGRNRQIQPVQAATMLKPVMEAVLRLHCDGIVHCDISPDNLLFDENQELKLIDLGASREIDETRDMKELREGYASPELYQDEGKIGPWTDLYAVCAVWYEMVTGKKVPSAPERIKKDTLRVPSEYVKISPEMESAFMQGLSMDMQQRYFSLENLMGRLSMSYDEKEQLGNAIRGKWGSLWIKLTTSGERISRENYGKQIVRSRIRKAGAVCLGALLIIILAVGGFRIYLKENPDKVIGYEIWKDKWEAKGQDAYQRVQRDSAKYKQDLAFVKQNAASVDNEYDTLTEYTITKKTAKEWGKISNSEGRFYLKADTLKRVLEAWRSQEKIDIGSSDFTGRITVYDTRKNPMEIELFMSRTYTYGENRITVYSDYNSRQIASVSFSGAENELISFATEIFPVICPELYLTETEVEEILQYVADSEAKIGVLYPNAKSRLYVYAHDRDEPDNPTEYEITIYATF